MTWSLTSPSYASPKSRGGRSAASAAGRSTGARQKHAGADRQSVSTAPRLTPTPEQEVAIEMARKMEAIKIKAYAGAGKSSTLRLIAEALAPRSGIYLAFNKAIALDAQAKMPGCVKAQTFHSLALSQTPNGASYINRDKKLTGKVVAAHFGLQPMRIGKDAAITPANLGYMLIEMVKRFCGSMDEQVMAYHMPTGDIEGFTRDDYLSIGHQLVGHARAMWALMSDIKERDFPSGHDVYVKLWAMGKPRIYSDYILYDECQDADPLMVHVMSQQQQPVFWVGDPWQSIYTWRGAVDAMTAIQTNHEAALTMSFRFGQPIADEANKVLRYLGETKPIIGNPRVTSNIEPARVNAVLCRTNASLVRELMARVGNGQVIGATGVDDARSTFTQLQSLREGKHGWGKFALFESWQDVVEHSESSAGADLRPYIALEKEYGCAEVLRCLDGVVNATSPRADVCLSTAHKAKGLEWDNVKLAGDFKLPSLDPESKQQPSAEELRLLYVALTRAKIGLDASALRMEVFK